MMKKFLILLFLLLINNPTQAINYNEIKEAKQPIVLYMYSPYCSACKQYSPIFEKLRKSYANGNMLFVKENVSKNSELAYMLNLNSVPSIFIVKNSTAYKIDYNCTWEMACISKILDSYK